jgi:hypothetical protein
MNLRIAFGLCDHLERDDNVSIIILTNTHYGQMILFWRKTSVVGKVF